MSADLVHAKRVIEGLLFVLGQPVPLKRIKSVLEDLDPQHLRGLLEQLNAEYAQTQRALRIQEVAGGYQLVTDPQLAPWMKRGFEAPRHDALSKAALETVAIIAYRQPLTKADIETLRGVDVTGTLDTLLERQLVRVVGRKDTPGRPLLYGTTNEFLRRFGLKSLENLPPLIPPPAASRQLVAGSAPTAQALRAAAGGGMTHEPAPQTIPLVPPPIAPPQADARPTASTGPAGHATGGGMVPPNPLVTNEERRDAGTVAHTH